MPKREPVYLTGACLCRAWAVSAGEFRDDSVIRIEQAGVCFEQDALAYSDL